MDNITARRVNDAECASSLGETPHSGATKHRIMVVDDHPIVREGMKQLTNAQPDLELCCETDHAAGAPAMVLSYAPALVICDISLVDDAGLDLIEVLRCAYPNLGLLAMSQHDEVVYAERALRAGANGYLMKREATATILRAIRMVIGGEIYLSNAMNRKLALGLINPLAKLHSPLAELSVREAEVLRLLGQGFSTRRISEKLNRSIKTVESHRANLKAKLNIDSGTDLVHFAFKTAS